MLEVNGLKNACFEKDENVERRNCELGNVDKQSEVQK